ncbi:S8 family serine peptidase [Pseudoalteromonas sp. SMS1]|uniref:S8 family peptidase n=1 Tax=Pseudoalteromonas sp. SMS1 TaxID=2908894 RepID=UPI001F415D5E|nr:S8 family serine peptidase [Pseudoalteromonas sp. SMS1]MCF2856214.1 S8 family serine peptidase [Pseudoalteromonas sp. SMS1]
MVCSKKSFLIAGVSAGLSLMASVHAQGASGDYLVEYAQGQISSNVLSSLKVIGRNGDNFIAQGYLSAQQVSGLEQIAGVVLEPDYGLSLSNNSLDYLRNHTHSLEALNTSELEPYWLRATGINDLPVALNEIPVCIIDSGVDSAHPDLPSDINGYHSVYSGFWNQDALSHGTHMAGIIAAQGNGIGVKGALSEGVAKLQVHKLIRTAHGKNSSITGGSLIEAIEVCANSGAKVINMSLSGDQYSPMTMSVIDRLTYDRGVIFVAAAGNHGSQIKKLSGLHNDALHYPASYHNVLSIGALDTNGIAASFSPANQEIDLVAPGSKIISTANRSYYAIQKVTLQQGALAEAPLSYTQVDVGIHSHAMQTALPQQCVYTLSTADAQLQRANRTLSYDTRVALNHAENSCKSAGGKVMVVNYPHSTVGYVGGLDHYTEFPTLLVHQWPGVSDFSNVTLKLDSYHSNYVVGAGTSQATAIISGGIARLWSQNPQWSRTQIINAIKETSYDLGTSGQDNVYGYGLPNFAKALEYLHAGRAPACPQEWYQNKPYSGGERVTFNGIIYTAHYWNKNMSPTNSPAMWQVEGECDTSNSSHSTPTDGGYSILDFSGLEEEEVSYSCRGLSLMCSGGR